MNTNYKGIDYGLGKTNIDKATGIRFGIINQHDVGQVWYERAAHEGKDHACMNCEYIFGSESAFGDEPINFFIDSDDYKAECGESGDIFITLSPYFTKAQFCSPCAPGACYLTNPCEDGEKAYCLGHDWFEGGVAPYPVFSVSTGEKVEYEQTTV